MWCYESFLFFRSSRPCALISIKPNPPHLFRSLRSPTHRCPPHGPFGTGVLCPGRMTARCGCGTPRRGSCCRSALATRTGSPQWRCGASTLSRALLTRQCGFGPGSDLCNVKLLEPAATSKWSPSKPPFSAKVCQKLQYYDMTYIL